MIRFMALVSFLSLSCIGLEANAYEFDVKVKNNTGAELTSLLVDYRPKGEPDFLSINMCWLLNSLAAGESYYDQCFRAAAEKWKRQIRVSFKCPGQGSRTITFPRNAKWYPRDHAPNNSDRYTVKIKASDC